MTTPSKYRYRLVPHHLGRNGDEYFTIEYASRNNFKGWTSFDIGFDSNGETLAMTRHDALMRIQVHKADVAHSDAQAEWLTQTGYEEIE